MATVPPVRRATNTALTAVVASLNAKGDGAEEDVTLRKMAPLRILLLILIICIVSGRKVRGAPSYVGTDIVFD